MAAGSTTEFCIECIPQKGPRRAWPSVDVVPTGRRKGFDKIPGHETLKESAGLSATTSEEIPCYP